MHTRNKLLMIGAASAGIILSGGTLLAQHAFAQTASSPGSGLAAFLAEKLGLKQTDVQTALDQYHTQQEANHQQTEVDRLTQAVTDGKITAAQKNAIIAEQAVIKTKLDAMKGMSQTDRITAMKQLKADIQTWATQNNINEKWLGPIGHGHGPGGPWKFGARPGNPATSTTHN